MTEPYEYDTTSPRLFSNGMSDADVERAKAEAPREERLFQIHFWQPDPSKRDAFKAEYGMRSMMVSQRGFTCDESKVSDELAAWYKDVNERHELPAGMEWMVVSEESELFWRTHAK